MPFTIKRIYEPAQAGDGRRVLVDRLWPRGVSKSKARLTAWMKQVAPSSALRIWFGHKPQRFANFARRYRRELAGNAAVAELRRLGRGARVTLLYGARDPKINHARVLQSVLQSRLSVPARSSTRSRSTPRRRAPRPTAARD
ncbi:MAG TPA: DUF488 family protein [Steroidobacteraceae bacterium]|jgi:uncharacterized protein YeaO (DUF488 family)